jgi:hypothetical protein
VARLPRRCPHPRPRRPPRAMRVLLTGGTGQVGAFVVPALAAAGHAVTHLARRPPPDGSAWLPWSLADPAPALPAADALVHLAFDHKPGAYRGGEGEDPRPLPAPQPRRLAGADRRRAQGRRPPRGLSLQPRRLRRRPPRRDPARDRRARAGHALRRDEAGGGGRLPGRSRRGRVARHGRLRPGSGRGDAQMGSALRRLPRRPARRPPRRHRGPRRRPRRRRPAAPGDGEVGGAFNASDLTLDRADLLAAVQARTGCPHQPAAARALAAARRDGLRPPARLRLAPGGPARLASFLDGLFGPREAA